jgi:hypothetical protein
MVEVVRVFVFTGFPRVGTVSVDVCYGFNLNKSDDMVLVESLVASDTKSKHTSSGKISK